ncbi:hypothetical protein [Peptoniphilus sp. HMSC062D09]|uniref:hypothetical protein n=1 Tax=Peptoniphilus sp. HMSC062D09 TaxID=1739305 RepID=UPI0008A44C35|nr:hypothetical protein [Peptoniphilus sp. HMSC062D09]OFK81136.1 hypothetical protein HMPREF2801_06015 [Peptoniphilus sp. HMSC062D09]
MKQINPIGRKPGDSIYPMACFCSSDGSNDGGVANFNSAKGKDTCSHCGCYCDSYGLPFQVNTGTYKSNASYTDRTSSI